MSEKYLGHIPQKKPRRWNGGIPGFPTRDWTALRIDVGSEAPCAWCGELARFHHILKHEATGYETRAGLVCAEYLTGDYEHIRKAEKKLKDRLYTRRKDRSKALPSPEVPNPPENTATGQGDAKEGDSQDAAKLFLAYDAWVVTSGKIIAQQMDIIQSRIKPDCMIKPIGGHELVICIGSVTGKLRFNTYRAAKQHALKYYQSMGELTNEN